MSYHNTNEDIQEIQHLEIQINTLQKSLMTLQKSLTECQDWTIKADQISFISGLEWALGVMSNEDEEISASAHTIIHSKIEEIESELI